AERWAAAGNRQRTMAQAQETADAELKAARTKANEIIDQAHRRGAQIIEQAKAEAMTEALRQKALVDAEIEASATRAREELRRQVSMLAVSGAERLLKREIDADAHKALLDELASEI